MIICSIVALVVLVGSAYYWRLMEMDGLVAFAFGGTGISIISYGLTGEATIW